MPVIKIEIKNPIIPIIAIPIAATFEVCSNSFLDGFFKTSQTLLHLRANEFKFEIIFINNLEKKSF